MSRISIDVSPEDHRKLKALAALQGKSMKDYLLEGKIAPTDPDDPLAKLEALLDERINRHHESGLRGRSSAKVILQDVLDRS